MTKMMRAARLHQVGQPFQVDTIPVPEVRPTDVLVEVKAAGVVPNLHNVVTNYPKWFPFLPLPTLPAIYGLDSAGIVSQVGSQVRSGIKPGDRAAFVAAITRLSAERRRDGAYAWGITEDAADPGLMLEWFQVESWAEHLRQHRRVSKADADVQEQVRSFHQGLRPPVVRHLIGIHDRDAR